MLLSLKRKKMNKEKQDILDVTFGDKKAMLIYLKEIELIESLVENTIKEAVIGYIKGWHNKKRDKGVGAEHIKLHLEKGSQGEITLDELINIGNSLREYLKIFKEPYLEDESKSGKVYEWENKNGIRFRVATDKIKGEGLIPPLSPFDDVIVTFYSDRNLSQRMEFKNPKVMAYYTDKENHQELINNKGFQCSEVAGACDILESGGEVSKPSHLQIKYTANQDFGKNPENIIPQNHNSSCSRFKNQLKNIGESLTKDREKLENAQKLQGSKMDIKSHKSHLRKQK